MAWRFWEEPPSLQKMGSPLTPEGQQSKGSGRNRLIRATATGLVQAQGRGVLLWFRSAQGPLLTGSCSPLPEALCLDHHSPFFYFATFIRSCDSIIFIFSPRPAPSMRGDYFRHAHCCIFSLKHSSQ